MLIGCLKIKIICDMCQKDLQGFRQMVMVIESGDLLGIVLVLMATVLGCHANSFQFESGYSVHMPDYDKVIYDVDLEPHHVLMKRSMDHHLRVHMHFDSSFDRLQYEHHQLIKSKVQEAVAFWQDTLKLRPTGAPIRLNRKCLSADVNYANGVRYCRDGCSPVTTCGDTVVPEKHLHSCYWLDSMHNTFYAPTDTSPGEAGVDFILYVAALSSSKCQQQTVAFAAHCQLESSLDRPIAGYINICPDSVSISIHKHEELLYTIKHEILHALGFTASLFAFYRDYLGRPLTRRDPLSNKPLVFNYSISVYQWSDQVIRSVTRLGWRLKGQTIDKVINVMVTPRVRMEVSRHFNCSLLEGAELEDQGIDGTAYTHWEKRLFENEFMTGTYTQNPVISSITLALMEDTGWYQPVYSNAMQLEWGKNLGCDFAMKSCYDWIQTRLQRNEDIHPFCLQVSRGRPVTDCTRNRKAVAICNLSEYRSNLPLIYQYFSSLPGVQASDVGRYGGGVALADYCPYLQEFVWKQDNDIIRGSRCALQQNSLKLSENFLLETYSPRAKCFNHGSIWALQKCSSLFQPHSGSGCYEYECSQETGLTILVQGKGYRCFYTGQQLDIEVSDEHFLYRGNITCPSCEEICVDSGIQYCPQEDRSVYRHLGSRRSRSYIPCSSPETRSAKLYIFTATVLAMHICSSVFHFL